MSISVMLEIKYDPDVRLEDHAEGFASQGFTLDQSQEPVLMAENSEGNSSVILYGTISSQAVMIELEAREGVIKVWNDAPIAPFADGQDDSPP